MTALTCSPHLWDEGSGGDDREILLTRIVEHGLGSLYSHSLIINGSGSRSLIQIGQLTWGVKDDGWYDVQPAKEGDPRGIRVRRLEKFESGDPGIPAIRESIAVGDAWVQLPAGPLSKIQELISNQTGSFDTRGVVGWLFTLEGGDEVWLISENPFGLYFDLKVPALAGDVPEWVREDYESKLIYDSHGA